jgi:ribosomal-protein-alanine N-acetyltransferase
MLTLIPIKETLDENEEFLYHANCRDTLTMTIDYYQTIGFTPPWIGYYASIDHKLVGSGGFKGKPKDNRIEIAYGTFENYRHQGIGTQICKALVKLAIQTDPDVIITARTLPENDFSSRVLQKNNFKLLGTVWDKDDGDVWEWQYQRKTDNQ